MSNHARDYDKTVALVFICDPKHPHYGESGTMTGKIISLLGTPMAEVKIRDCKHGTDGCFVEAGQVRREKRGHQKPARRIVQRVRETEPKEN